MNKQNGFTLLEIIVAMAIIALALGTSFSLLANSKRLAFKAAYQIEQVVFLRSAINISQLREEPEYPEHPDDHVRNLELETEEILEPPDRQTSKIQIGIEPYLLEDSERGIKIPMLRLKKLKVGESN
ncbi:type II secretion system protein [Candidatus Albibeggiatoa sp. nov. BB20]|uniref:type II secretion system protein n=1 Tax=Candidatus Albibeggiatoa sp. nov. BB20 TaxID=3162723 RepID=UPI00336545A9